MTFLSLALQIATATCTPLVCPGGSGCDQQLGPAAANGEDAQLGYDINPGTGNLFYTEQDIRMQPALGPILTFTRYYNSQNTGANVGLGNGWSHTYSWQTVPTVGTTKVVRADGRVIYFTGSGPSSWAPQTGEFGTLTGTPATGFTYVDKFGTAYSFDTSNRLTTIAAANNTAVSVTYSSGTLISSVTSGDLSLSFTYSGGTLATVADPIGNTWTYGVSGGNLHSVTTPNNDGSGHSGLHSYVYTSQTVNSTLFSNGGNTSALVEVTALQSFGTTAVVGLYSYNASSQVVAAASSAMSSSFQREVTLSYTLCTNTASTTTATLSSGTKTITSAQVSGVQRITGIAATAGSGAATESNSLAYSWNTTLTLQSETDGNGIITAFTYDAIGNPITIVEASGTALARTTAITYHPVLATPLTITRVSADGLNNHVTTFDYDSDYNSTYNQPLTMTNYLHQAIESGRTDASLSGALGTTASNVTQFLYDANNRITKVISPNGSGTTLAYWPSGSAHNASNRLKSATITGVAALVWTYGAYDPDGRLASLTDPNSIGFSYTYNQLGDLTGVTRTAGAVNEVDLYAYDLADELTTHTAPDSSYVQQEYDQARRLWRRSAWTPPTSTTAWSELLQFDANNNVVSYRRFAGLGSNPVGSTICATGGSEQICQEKTWNSFQRLATIHTLDSTNSTCTAPGCTISYTYDNNMNLAAVLEAGQSKTRYSYDALNRVAAVLLPIDGGVSGAAAYSSLSYDINDRLITRTDPADSTHGGVRGSGRNTIFVYDDFGNLVSLRSPDNGAFVVNYDGNGLRTSAIDALGHSFSYSYDAANRLKTLTAPAAYDNVTYSYDQTGTIGAGVSYAFGVGKLTSVGASDGGRNVHYAYDMNGRTADEVNEVAGAFVATGYSWGPNGNLKSLTYPDGDTVTYNYPSTGGYAPIPLPSGASVVFSGSAASLASSASYFGDGVLASLTYGNGDGRVVSRNHRGEITQLQGTAASTVMNQQYVYDSAGLGDLTTVHHFQGTSSAWDWLFTYDPLHRITGYSTTVRPTTDAFTFKYDEAGNRTASVYNGSTTTYNYSGSTTDQLSSLSPSADSWTYDANGLVSTHTASGVTTTHKYDNKLLRSSDTVSGVTTVQYAQDGLGRRWQTIVAATGYWTQYYYDVRGRVLEEYSYQGQSANGAAAYSVVDHVYMGDGAGEVSRILRMYEKTCPTCAYSFVDQEIDYVHEDYRKGPFAIRGPSGLEWEAEIDPFGNAPHVGLPGLDGKIGTSDDGTATVANWLRTGRTVSDPNSEFSSAPHDRLWRGGCKTLSVGASDTCAGFASTGVPNLHGIDDTVGLAVYGSNGLRGYSHPSFVLQGTTRGGGEIGSDPSGIGFVEYGPPPVPQPPPPPPPPTTESGCMVFDLDFDYLNQMVDTSRLVSENWDPIDHLVDPRPNLYSRPQVFANPVVSNMSTGQSQYYDAAVRSGAGTGAFGADEGLPTMSWALLQNPTRGKLAVTFGASEALSQTVGLRVSGKGIDNQVVFGQRDVLARLPAIEHVGLSKSLSGTW